MRIEKVVLGQIISYTNFDDAFNNLRYKRHGRDWAIV